MMGFFRRIAAWVSVAVLLAALTSGCAAGHEPVEPSPSTSSMGSEYSFLVLNVAPDEHADTATATISIPVFVTGVEVTVFAVERHERGAEVCTVRILEEVESSGACAVVEPLQRQENGTLHGLRLQLTGLPLGHHQFDVVMFPVPQDGTTGEFRYDFQEPPVIARLSVPVF